MTLRLASFRILHYRRELILDVKAKRDDDPPAEKAMALRRRHIQVNPKYRQIPTMTKKVPQSGIMSLSEPTLMVAKKQKRDSQETAMISKLEYRKAPLLTYLPCPVTSTPGAGRNENQTFKKKTSATTPSTTMSLSLRRMKTIK